MGINKILDLGQFYQTYAKLCNLFVLLLPLYTRKILLRSGQCDLYWWWKIYWGKIICHGFNHTYFKGYLFPLKKTNQRKNKIRLLIFCSKETFFDPLQFGSLSSARCARDHIPDQTSRPLEAKFKILRLLPPKIFGTIIRAFHISATNFSLQNFFIHSFSL